MYFPYLYYVSGCIAAGFTRSCAFGACRVDLPDGGHCFCDLWCIRHMHNYPQYNCCSDNPSEGDVGTETDTTCCH